MDLSRRVSDVLNTCGGGEFDGCEERIRPFLDDTLECVSESIMLQKRAALAQVANRSRENFATVTTRTSYALLWLQAQKIQSLMWRDGIVILCRV